MLKDRRWLAILVAAASVLPFSGCIDAVPDGITAGITSGLSTVVQSWIELILTDLAPK